jgi:hypothetical protein
VSELARVADPVVGADTLAYLGLDPRNPEVHALVLLCQRYRLDPLLGHAAIIKTAGGNRAYITRDGMLEIAHRSGQLDGIVVDDQHRTEHGGHSATVSVWRKDMKHPFTYKGGCGHDEPQSKQGNGPEMALARAERRALRRAFSIPAADDADEPYEQTGEINPVAHALDRLELAHRLEQLRQDNPGWYDAVRGWWKANGRPPLGHDDFSAAHAAELADLIDHPDIIGPQTDEPTPADVIDGQPEAVDEPAYRYDPDDGRPFT